MKLGGVSLGNVWNTSASKDLDERANESVRVGTYADSRFKWRVITSITRNFGVLQLVNQREGVWR